MALSEDWGFDEGWEGIVVGGVDDGLWVGVGGGGGVRRLAGHSSRPPRFLCLCSRQ